MLPTIYLLTTHVCNEVESSGLWGIALAEDGTVLYSYFDVDEFTIKCRLGWLFSSKRPTSLSRAAFDAYNAHYPDGFYLAWVADIGIERTDVQQAIERNQERVFA